jgi:hypothetical protein
VPGLWLSFAFRPNNLQLCWAATVFDVGIAGGRTARTAVGDEVFTTMSREPGTIVSSCSRVGLVVQDDFENPVLAAGIVLGEDPGRRSP